MRNRLIVLLWLLIVLLTLVQQFLFSGYTMDDAFISFRYARNVASGQGWVYNPGGEPVEGFTNFLWTLLLIPCFWLRIEPMPAAQLLGALCSVGVLGLTLKLAQSGMEKPQSPLALLAPLLLSLTGAFTYQAVTGLETQLFILGLVIGIYGFLRRDTRSLIGSAAGFAIAALTRPEAVALYGLTLLFLLIAWKRGDAQRRQVLCFALVFLIPIVLFQLWRVRTFGDWLPNTYYTKVGTPGETIPEGWKYLYDFFQKHGTFLPWALALLPLIWYRWRVREVYLLSIVAAQCAIVVYEGGDWMPLHRLLAPMLPALFVLLTQGVDIMRQVYNRIQAQQAKPLRGGSALAAGWLVAVAAVLFYPSIGVMKEARVRPELYARSHVAMGHWLRQQCQPDDRIALSDIGQIGYYSDLWVIDLVGLTDRTIARSPGGLHKKQYDPLYVLDQKPRYIVLVCARVGGQFVIRGFETDKQVYRHPRFAAEYRLLHEESMRFHYKDAYSYWIFERMQDGETP